MIQVKSERVKKLADVLNVFDKSKKLAVYNAIAFYVAKNKNYSKVEIKNFVYELAEVAIVDRDILYNLILNYLELNKTGNVVNKVLSASSFIDVLVNPDIFNKASLEAIESNFNLYKQTIIAIDYYMKGE
jgi:hypothetical protein